MWKLARSVEPWRSTEANCAAVKTIAFQNQPLKIKFPIYLNHLNAIAMIIGMRYRMQWQYIINADVPFIAKS
ncbi:unnamed protein product [Arabidopsis arenosa]|uniref:Uncharacterized protein n=1 Tax=Arabidopsis arenosa TaxID=38785 RepID=A0A8S2AIB5_ARAAE|nr:unnamed protein product [Arabidopsis arenosa]